MPMKIHIIGAGLSGLLTSQVFADHNTTVYDLAPEVPNNHHNVLRFRTNAAEALIGLPFKKVNVLKAVQGGTNPVADAIRYSVKVTGKIHPRSVMSTEPVKRFIAPPDLIPQLAKRIHFMGGVNFLSEDFKDRYFLPGLVNICISTLPASVTMPYFFPDRVGCDFSYQKGWTATMSLQESLDCSLNATVYDVSKDQPWYRATLCEGEVIFEGVGDPPEAYPYEWLRAFGLSGKAATGCKINNSTYQKISELVVRDRKRLDDAIWALGEHHDIYSIGRFATWKPKLLLDGVIGQAQKLKSDLEKLYA